MRAGVNGTRLSDKRLTDNWNEARAHSVRRRAGARCVRKNRAAVSSLNTTSSAPVIFFKPFWFVSIFRIFWLSSLHMVQPVVLSCLLYCSSGRLAPTIGPRKRPTNRHFLCRKSNKTKKKKKEYSILYCHSIVSTSIVRRRKIAATNIGLSI